MLLIAGLSRVKELPTGYICSELQRRLEQSHPDGGVCKDAGMAKTSLGTGSGIYGCQPTGSVVVRYVI